MIPCARCLEDVFTCGCPPERDPDFIEHEPMGGTYVITAIEDMRALAKFTGVPVICQFNDKVLLAEPTSTYDELVQQWERESPTALFSKAPSTSEDPAMETQA